MLSCSGHGQVGPGGEHQHLGAPHGEHHTVAAAAGQHPDQQGKHLSLEQIIHYLTVGQHVISQYYNMSS